jgi:hypothetical protein
MIPTSPILGWVIQLGETVYGITIRKASFNVLDRWAHVSLVTHGPTRTGSLGKTLVNDLGKLYSVEAGI